MRFLSPVRRPDVAVVRAAWERFVRHGAIDPVVRAYVARGWTRSRAAGCDPRQARAESLAPRETEALLAQEARLVRVAEPFLAALSRAAGSDRHAAMLSDGQGRLLLIAGDEATMADENFPHEGALLSEATSGANGIGTTVAENGYVELVGPEHYIEGFHAFTCQGVPLAGPDDRLAGVVSMSVRRLETADRVRDILFCASEAAQCELLASWLGDVSADSGPESAILERLRQDMVQRITTARLRLELAARQIASGSDASATIHAAHDLSQRFRREADIWRELAVPEIRSPERERIELSDLVENFIDLLQTEARVCSVTLKWAKGDRVEVLDDPRTVSRNLLGLFLTALQTGRPGATLLVSVTHDRTRASVSISDPDRPDAVLAALEAARCG